MAVNNPELLKQLTRQFEMNDSNLVVNSALTGGDFLATTIRAWPQFFFGYVLPLPLLQVVGIAAACYLWTSRAKTVRDNSIMTDEFLLSYFALDSKSEEIEARIAVLAASESERINRIRDFASNHAHKKAIRDALNNTSLEASKSKDTAIDKASQQWSNAFMIGAQFAVAHWVLWMSGVMCFYAQGRLDFNSWEGVHTEYAENPTDVPGAFEDNTLFILQFAIPAAITAAAIFYNWYYKQSDQQKQEQDAWKARQAAVRQYYLKNNTTEVLEQPLTDNPAVPLLADNKANPATFTERRVVGLSLATAFFDAFLVGNLLAWPVTAFADRMMSNSDNRGEALDSETKILCVFASVMTISAIHVWFRYINMKKELRDHGMEEIKPESTHTVAQSFFDYYNTHRRTAANIVLDRFSGSGGILAIRMIFDGGIGGYLVDKKDPSGMDHLHEIMPIAVSAMALMIILNLWQTYYAAQRATAMTAHVDNKLRQPA